ncbi:hypothetical protein GCM10022277_04010 [Litoribacillus peritrichatus]|uniref:Transposase n=1 Tax=Litoribacillus peritrichatus TaxID=718191 RepID=A0ABP7M0T9_9GAMM
MSNGDFRFRTWQVKTRQLSLIKWFVMLIVIKLLALDFGAQTIAKVKVTGRKIHGLGQWMSLYVEASRDEKL